MTLVVSMVTSGSRKYCYWGGDLWLWYMAMVLVCVAIVSKAPVLNGSNGVRVLML